MVEIFEKFDFPREESIWRASVNSGSGAAVTAVVVDVEAVAPDDSDNGDEMALKKERPKEGV